MCGKFAMTKRDARKAARQLAAMARRRGEWTKAGIYSCQVCAPVDGKAAWHVTSGGSKRRKRRHAIG
jgi:hypothetical protein